MNELGRNWRVEVIEEEAVVACSKAISLSSPEGIEEDYKNRKSGL
jgi:hypothetical protein